MTVLPHLLDVDRVSVLYRGRKGSTIRALDDVSIRVSPGEAVGVVGESGSGKSTLGRVIVGLVEPTSGSVSFEGVDVSRVSASRRRHLHGEIQAVFQDPLGSFNPAFRINRSLREPLAVQGRVPRAEWDRRVSAALEQVRLPPGSGTRFPASFSGGQLQRLSIARALVTQPKLLICDEAVSALDLSAQAQVLNLLDDLRRRERLSYLFISHDLGVVRHLCDQVTVLYRGRVMESGSTKVVCGDPAHPYTQLLLASSPLPDPRLQRSRHRERAVAMMSRAVDPLDDSTACSFAARCPFAHERCVRERPITRMLADDRLVACHLHEPEASTKDDRTMLMAQSDVSQPGSAS